MWLCYASSWGRVAGPLGSLQNPGSSWTWRNGPESLPQSHRATQSLAGSLGSPPIFFIWVENTYPLTGLFKFHWCFLICYQQIADVTVVRAHNQLVLNMVALLDYQQVACMVWLSVSLSTQKPFKVHSVLWDKRLVIFHLLKQKFG